MMLFRLKQTKLFCLNLIGLTSSIGFVLACDQTTIQKADYPAFDNLLGFSNLIKNYKYKTKKIIKARLIKWKDGDTFDYEKYNETTKQWVSTNGGKKLTLRIAFIDTPEYHDPNASDRARRGNITDEEFKWAKAATEWAKTQIPVNSEIRIWEQGTDSYSRTVGSVFYNQNRADTGFKENFSINIIRAGYTLPRLESKSNLILAKGDEAEILNYLAPTLYAAWKEAQAKKVNLFGLSQTKLTLVYKKHGVPNNKLSFVQNILAEWLNEPTFKKYQIYKS